jgi:hypothetical protein
LRQGEVYQDSDHELDGEGAIRLLESSVASRSRLLIKGKYCNLEFEVPPERPLAVYDSREGFWAISEVSPVSARRIIMTADDGEQFGNLIPETTKEWGAYGLGSASNG